MGLRGGSAQWPWVNPVVCGCRHLVPGLARHVGSEGLLQALPEDEVRNLIAYLRGKEQVPLP